MNGPQHFQRAEELFREIEGQPGLITAVDPDHAALQIALAQAHASLAAAAAIVDANVDSLTPNALQAWGSAIQNEPQY